MTALSDAQVYAQQLLPKRHGYPLWVPEPYGNSVPYRTKGVRVGDVGYVTEDGAFETLFNVRASSDDPINCRGVPDGFERIHIPIEDIAHISNFHEPNCVVTSASKRRRAMDVEVSTPDIPGAAPGVGGSLQFTWTSSQGAILHLPDGACRLTCPAELFRDVAIRGAKSWYKFANVTLRRGVPNGALYLVTGCDKATSWMVGSFSDKTSDVQTSFKLSTAGICDARLAYSYTWDTSSPAVFRTGPLSPRNDSLDSLQRHSELIDQDDSIFAADAPNGKTQCAFIRGYRIMLRTNPVSAILGGSAKIEVSSISSTNPKDIAQAFLDRRFTTQAGAALRDFTTRGDQCRHDADNSEPFLLHTLGSCSEEACLEYVPGVQEPYHPSTLINELLLYLSPQAQVSLVHDEEWLSVLHEEDSEIPNGTALLSRVLEKYRVTNSTSSTFLVQRRPRTVASVDTPLIKNTKKQKPSFHEDKPQGSLNENSVAGNKSYVFSHQNCENYAANVLRQGRTPECCLSEVTNTRSTPTPRLPRRVKKPNGRPHTHPTKPTCSEEERPQFLRRNKSCDFR